jgi:ATP-dependent helicase YprA (DUF1998 family)
MPPSPGRSPISPSPAPGTSALRLTLGLVPVSVSHQVIGYLRRRLSGGDRLRRTRHAPAPLETTAAMYTVTPEALQDNGISAPRIPGSRRTLPNTPRSACCRWSPAATAATSAGSPPRSGKGPALGVRLRRTSRRCRLRRTRLPAGEHLARRHRSSDRACECPQGCPSCAVTQMRERERSLDKPGAIRVSPSFSTNSPRRKVNRGRRPTPRTVDRPKRHHPEPDAVTRPACWRPKTAVAKLRATTVGQHDPCAGPTSRA